MCVPVARGIVPLVPSSRDLMTAVRPSAQAPSRAGLVHDGGAWVAADAVGRYAPARPPVAHAVPDGIDPWQPSDAELREWVGEWPDGMGGFLRVAPQVEADRVADDEVLLSGHELYRSVDGCFEVEALEEPEMAAWRRRHLATVLRHARVGG